MQRNKNIKIFLNYFLGPLLFIWLSFSIYNQIKEQNHIEASWVHIKQSFSSSKIIYLLLAVLLMFFNWGLEARKWQLAIRGVCKINFLHAFKAVLSGVSVSVTTPNRVGEYLGRIAYLPDGSRLKSIPNTLVGSLSQLIITFVCGTIGFIVFKEHLIAGHIISTLGYRFAMAALFLIIIFLTLIYFGIEGIEGLLERWMKNSRYLYLIQSLRTFNGQLMMRLLLLSFLRYCVFMVQYYLLFSFFNVDVSAGVVWSVVSLVFLAMAVIPTISLVEVGLRGQISLKLMNFFSANSLGVGLTSVTIWIINLIMPAIAGSILFLGIKLFERRNETD